MPPARSVAAQMQADFVVRKNAVAPRTAGAVGTRSKGFDGQASRGVSPSRTARCRTRAVAARHLRPCRSLARPSRDANDGVSRPSSAAGSLETLREGAAQGARGCGCVIGGAFRRDEARPIGSIRSSSVRASCPGLVPRLFALGRRVAALGDVAHDGLRCLPRRGQRDCAA